MSLFGEPENEVYRLAKSGTLALLDAVNKADAKGASALASKENACDAVMAYLDASFLGSFLRSGQRIPYAQNAGVLGTYIDFLDGELERGAPHATSLHQTHLKLLAYVAAIEAEAPLSLFGNALEFLGGKRQDFDFGIYPRAGRFISEDPIGFAGGDVNLYAYVVNSPSNYIGPEGKYIGVVAIGGGIIVAAGVVAYYTWPAFHEWVNSVQTPAAAAAVEAAGHAAAAVGSAGAGAMTEMGGALVEGTPAFVEGMRTNIEWRRKQYCALDPSWCESKAIPPPFPPPDLKHIPPAPDAPQCP